MLGALAVDFHRSIHIDCLHQFSQGIGVKPLNAHIGNIGGQRNTPFALRFVDSPDIPVSGLFGLAERTYGEYPYKKCALSILRDFRCPVPLDCRSSMVKLA